MNEVSDILLARIRTLQPHMADFREEDILKIIDASNVPLNFSNLINTLCAHKVTPINLNLFSRLTHSMHHRDSLTGFNTPLYKEMNFTLMQLWQERHKSDALQSTFYFSTDISNLRGLNFALSGAYILDPNEKLITDKGRELTDGYIKLFKEIIRGIIEHEMHEARQQGRKVYADYYRTGGDELDVFVLGLTRDEMASIQKSIVTQIKKVAQNAGLDEIAHPKYPYMGEYTGIGVACDFIPFPTRDKIRTVTLSTMTKQVEERIEERKTSYNPQSQQVAGKTKLNDEDIARAKSALIDEASRRQHLLNEEITHSPFPFGNYIPPHPSAFSWPDEKWRDNIEREIAAHALPKHEADLLRHIGKLYKPVDLLTGCDISQPKESIGRALNFVYADSERRAHFITFETQNFAGMNKKFGHEGCDRIFKDLTSFITESMKGENVHFYRPNGYGERISALILGKNNEEIADMIQNVCAKVEAYTAKHNLNELDNPRYPEDAYKGVRFVVGATHLSASHAQNPQNPLDEVDSQIATNKATRLCFHGQGLGLNQAVGFDGSVVNRHHSSQYRNRKASLQGSAERSSTFR